MQSFTFLGDSFILGSTSAPPALLVYSLEQRPADDWDTTQASAHLLRFLFGSHFQGPHGTSTILLASDPSPGWLPSAGQVPFQIAGDERMVAIYSQFFDNWEDEIFLIPTKTLLGQIESLPIEEGFDVEWELYGPQLIERVPEHSRWDDLWPYFVFGMRCILPKVVHLDDKPMVIIRDLSPRRCLRASKEERKESDALYHAITWTPRRTPYPRSILKCAPLPESITLHWSTLLISEDGIVVVENVRHRKTCVFIAARLIRLACRETPSGGPQSFICSRSDKESLDREDRLTGFVRVVISLDSFHRNLRRTRV